MYDRTKMDALCTKFREIGDKLSMELESYKAHLLDQPNSTQENDDVMQAVIDVVDTAVAYVEDDIPAEPEEDEDDDEPESEEGEDEEIEPEEGHGSGEKVNDIL